METYFRMEDSCCELLIGLSSAASLIGVFIINVNAPESDNEHWFPYKKLWAKTTSTMLLKAF